MIDSTAVGATWADAGVMLAEAIGAIGIVWAICWAVVKVKTSNQ